MWKVVVEWKDCLKNLVTYRVWSNWMSLSVIWRLYQTGGLKKSQNMVMYSVQMCAYPCRRLPLLHNYDGNRSWRKIRKCVEPRGVMILSETDRTMTTRPIPKWLNLFAYRPRLQLTLIIYTVNSALATWSKKAKLFTQTEYLHHSPASFSPYLHIWSVTTCKNQYHWYAWGHRKSEIQYHIKHLLLLAKVKTALSPMYITFNKISMNLAQSSSWQDTLGKQDALLGLGLTVAV